MIIQTGMRTDIPAFYSKWFMNRIKEGYVLVRNPYNERQRFQFKEDFIMAEVEVIKAVEGPILRKRDYEGKPLVITRQRVAAYVRVSTDGDEQLEKQI